LKTIPRWLAVAAVASLLVAAGCSSSPSTTSPSASSHAATTATAQPTATAPATPPATSKAASLDQTVGLSVGPNDSFETAGPGANVVVATPAYVPLRTDAVWSDTAPPDQTQFMADLRADAAYGHPLLAIADYAPPAYASPAAKNAAKSKQGPDSTGWCIGFNCGASPGSAAAYASFAANVAGTCLRTLKVATKCAIELWNEPNDAEFWQPAPDPNTYAQLVKAACTAVHQINPGIKVISGGLAPNTNPIGFLTAVFAWLQANHVPHCIDAVGFHPYGPDGISLAGQVYQVMQQFGYGNLPIWATEVGLHTNEASAASAPVAFQKFISGWFANAWAGPVYWYTWLDDPGDQIRGLVPNPLVKNAPGNPELEKAFLTTAAQHDGA